MATPPYLLTEAGKTAWKIGEEQKKCHTQIAEGWDKLDFCDLGNREAVLEAGCGVAGGIREFEEKAFVEKVLPVKFVEIPPPVKNRQSSFPSVTFFKNLTEKFISAGSSLLKGKTEKMERKPSLASIVEEEQVGPVEEVQSEEEEIVFRPIVEDGPCSSVSPVKFEISPATRRAILAEKKAILETMNHGNKMSAIKKKGKYTKRQELKETEDEMLDRLIRENQIDTKFAVGDLIHVDEEDRAKLDQAAEERRRFVREYVSRPVEDLVKKERLEKEKELKDEHLQNLLALKISKLEPTPISEVLSKSNSTGAFALECIDRAVELFIQDIKNAMREGMKPESIENWFFDRFKENVILPDPDDDAETKKKRSAMVHEFMWRYTQMYMNETTNYGKIRSMTYLQLFSHMQDGEYVMMPTIEALIKMEGTPEFDAKEKAILRTILAQHFTQLECVKMKF